MASGKPPPWLVCWCSYVGFYYVSGCSYCVYYIARKCPGVLCEDCNDIRARRVKCKKFKGRREGDKITGTSAT